MLTALLLAAAVGAGPYPRADAADAIVAAQSSYRSCIADRIAGSPKNQSADQALAAALGKCRDTELALRAATQATPNGNAADTLAIVLDTRIEGEEAGLKRRGRD
jgi:hypothetical protein